MDNMNGITVDGDVIRAEEKSKNDRFYRRNR